ncbi:MAG: nitronate monooxygenase [Eubacterium sp.]|nr:nitronate monooxygenase [Eubacterium sp.]
MNLRPLVIGELKAEIPVIQGGMGVGISLANLAGAVANEGGVGIISTAQIGYKEKDFYENPLRANLRAIRQEFQKARKISPDGIIGFNIMTALNHYKEQVIEAVKSGADIIISGAGLPVELPELVKGYKTKIAPIVSGKKSAEVILKYWDKKYATTADMIVIEGPKAGGHLGFSKEEVIKYENESYDNEVLQIKEVVQTYREKYKKYIPIVLAGGISKKEEINHALALGMDGVQVASAFVTTAECDADVRYKESYIHAEKEDISIVKSPVGMPGRAIKNKFMTEVMNGKKFSPERCLRCLKKCNPAEIPYCITERLINAAKGDVDNGLLFCGGNSFEQKEISTVHQVMKRLFEN